MNGLSTNLVIIPNNDISDEGERYFTKGNRYIPIGIYFDNMQISEIVVIDDDGDRHQLDPEYLQKNFAQE